jgi:dUTP pyrophosphatase
MYKIAEFNKVSEKQFVSSCEERGITLEIANESYNRVMIPLRATSGSAGYDFVAPFSFYLNPGESIEIPTGIRAKIDEGWVLMIYPRSGLGFKYNTVLANTVGIIDSDYYFSLNEGHIIIKLINKSSEGKILSLKAGDKFAQGVFTQYGITLHDNAKTSRDGGFGSTTKI